MVKKLFEPIQIGGMHLKNRVVFPAMGTRMADENRNVTQRLIDYHVERVKGGCGLNMVEVAAIHTPSAPAYFLSISEDSYIEGHKKLTDAIHEAGGKAGLQLWQGSIAVGMDPKARKLVVNDLSFKDFTLPAITKEEIEEIIECYGKAAKRAAEAGYDCVEFHCAHNYLPHSFLSGGLNHRKDEYGGSFENRARFPLACIQAIRQNLPKSMPIFMRIGACDDCLEGGLTIEDVIAFCKLAKEAGVDVLDVSRGNIITQATVYEVPPIDLPRGFNVDNAARIRKETNMLTIAVGRINLPSQAEAILEEDKADLIVIGRGQLADPYFCQKAKEGKEDEIVHCVACNQGCFDGFCDVINRPFITCLRNPMIGHEKEWELKATKNPKKVLIIGGGMAGLEAAKVLHVRGHKPTICEKTDHLGGQFITAGQAPGKQEMKEATIAFGKQIEAMQIPVHYQIKVDVNYLKEHAYDVVMIASGASSIDLPLEGKNLKPVVQAHDLLDHKVSISGDVCVIGGGLVGLECADFLASRNHKVSVVEMNDEVGKDLGRLRKICVQGKLHSLNVDIYTSTKCQKISKEGVVATKGEESIVIPCDSVVMAVGSCSNPMDDVMQYCEEQKIPYYIFGDAKKARRALNAVEEAFELASTLE